MRRFSLVSLALALFVAACGSSKSVTGGTGTASSSGGSTGGTTGALGGTSTGGASDLSAGSPCTANGQCLSTICGAEGAGHCCVAACAIDDTTCGATSLRRQRRFHLPVGIGTGTAKLLKVPAHEQRLHRRRHLLDRDAHRLSGQPHLCRRHQLPQHLCARRRFTAPPSISTLWSCTAQMLSDELQPAPRTAPASPASAGCRARGSAAPRLATPARRAAGRRAATVPGPAPTLRPPPVGRRAAAGTRSPPAPAAAVALAS